MRNITYKYNVGDTVELKPKHYCWADVMGTKVLITAAEIVERRDYNGPAYALGGCAGFYKENCFVGLASDASKNLTCRYKVACVDTLQGPETKCDVDDSGESESKWYRISFSAKLSPDDLRAMKKCFFDAMNESMEIYDLEGLEIKEA